jgi:predicted nucleic acid-binding protein
MSQANLVGLDTSVILRLLVGEPVAQASRAVAELDRMRAQGKQGAVSDLVVSETYFALQYHYDVPKQVALDKLREFLESPEIEPLGEALTILQQSNLAKAKPGFVDRMIHAEYLKKASCMVTFEKASAKLPSVAIP